MKTILMSIKKDPFDALVNGTKQHEFRRRFYLNEPCQAVLYVSSPVKAICGVAIFDVPITATVDELVKLIKTHRFSSEKNLRNYLAGLKSAKALPLKRIKAIPKITLDQLKKIIPSFRPPQSYCNLDYSRYEPVLKRLKLYET